MLKKLYKEIIQKTHIYSQYKPIALKVLQTALEYNYKIILVSDPVTPKSWLDIRLKWAKLLDFPFNYISTIENSYACKSLKNLIFFEHLTDQINVLPEFCLMVSDEQTYMIASKLDMKTFLVITKLKKQNIRSCPEPTFKVTLSDLKILIENNFKMEQMNKLNISNKN